MSGGSWSYLYSKDIEELMNGSTIELLQDMSDRLVALGYADVAQDTQRLTEYIKSANIRIETLFEMLSPIFRAVEWFDSGDWGKETLNNEVLKYRNSNFDIYSKAIDDFALALCKRKDRENSVLDEDSIPKVPVHCKAEFCEGNCDKCVAEIMKVAEQMKKGEPHD